MNADTALEICHELIEAEREIRTASNMPGGNKISMRLAAARRKFQEAAGLVVSVEEFPKCFSNE